jgi:endonuclease/exonuclease/phosphatase family metal-dependent hydrolase
MTDSIQVISWNILNPDPDFVKMSLRLVVNQKNTKNNRSPSVYERSRKLAVINEKRYHSQRKPNILGIIAKWFSDNPTRFVLCLQEVCPDMYAELMSMYGENRIRKTNLPDIKPEKVEEKVVLKEIDDYRCTLISDDLEFLESGDINLKIEDVRKNALYTKVQIKDTEIQFDCVNLHNFYTWADKNLLQVFQTIFGVLSQSDRFFICGDFNKPYERIYEIMRKISVDYKDGRLYMPAINNHQNSFTSFNTRPRNNRINPPSVVNGFLSLQVIDHIIVGNRFSMPKNPKIISKINNREIFYNLSGIETMLRKHELLNLKEENSGRILEEWQKHKFKNISDHKPVIARIDILPKP